MRSFPLCILLSRRRRTVRLSRRGGLIPSRRHFARSRMLPCLVLVPAFGYIHCIGDFLPMMRSDGRFCRDWRILIRWIGPARGLRRVILVGRRMEFTDLRRGRGDVGICSVLVSPVAPAATTHSIFPLERKYRFKARCRFGRHSSQ